MLEEFSEAPQSYALQPGEIHVWGFRLASTYAEVAEIMDPLSQPEKDRASRCRFEKDQARFISGRATLRLLLGLYTGIPPEKIAFRYEAQGKPMLADSPAWQFNLSHSRELALFAIGREQPVGIDLEQIDPAFPCAEVAEDILSEAELHQLSARDPADRLPLFFQIWTAKEALLKAVGKGFSIEPKSIELRFDISSPLQIACAPAEFEGATLHSIAIREDFAAALATFTPGGRVETFRFRTVY